MSDIEDKFYSILHPIRERLEKEKIVKVSSKDLTKSGATSHRPKSSISIRLPGRFLRRICCILGEEDIKKLRKQGILHALRHHPEGAYRSTRMEKM